MDDGIEAKPPTSKRKLKVLVITMGGPRQERIQQMFQNDALANHFEPPVFSPGISSRKLRNRYEFFQIANRAGLLPPAEWQAIQTSVTSVSDHPNRPDQFFDCLNHVPIPPIERRRGSQYDKQLHYSVEFWRKAKGLNRGRAVLACSLAHLIALDQLTREGFDVLVEDNIRVPINDDDSICANRILECIQASLEWQEQTTSQLQPSACHFRYFGWLGSVPNLKWIFQNHIPKRRFERMIHEQDVKKKPPMTVFPFPLPEDLNEDMKDLQGFEPANDDDEYDAQKSPDHEETDTNGKTFQDRKPGGNPIWGCYAYWMSRQAYETVLETLRNDVGAMLWKGKRMRCYSVKPIDKLLPRQTMAAFGRQSVHIPTHPTFFRAPMLTSKIHSQWDPEFCKSTEYQLSQCGLTWSDLWLSDMEQEIVQHYLETSEWLTPSQLQEAKSRVKRC